MDIPPESREWFGTTTPRVEQIHLRDGSSTGEYTNLTVDSDGRPVDASDGAVSSRWNGAGLLAMDTEGTADPNARSNAKAVVLNGAMRVAISTTHVIAFFNSAVIGPIDAFVGTPAPEAGVGFKIIGSTQPEPSGLAVSWPLGDIDCVQTFWEKKWRGRRVTGCEIRGDRPLTVLRFTVALPAASDWSSQADRQSDMEQFESLALNVARAAAQYRMAQNPEDSSRLRQIHDGQWTDGVGVSTAHLSA